MEKPVDTSRKRPISQWEAMEFVWELLILIALPTTLAAFGGRWMDKHWHIAPWGTIIGLLLALAISGTLVLKKGKQMAERMKSPPTRDS